MEVQEGPSHGIEQGVTGLGLAGWDSTPTWFCLPFNFKPGQKKKEKEKVRSLLAQGLKGVVGLGTWDSDPVSLSLPSTSPFNKRTFLLRSWRVGDRGLVEEVGRHFSAS